MKRTVSRRDFLKLTGMGIGAMALDPFERFTLSRPYAMQFPTGERLGRISVFPNFYSTEIKTKPNETVSMRLRCLYMVENKKFSMELCVFPGR